MEVYGMVTGLYYDLQVDYANQLWMEYGNSIGHNNVENGVSCAIYWSLILRYVYDKEGIMVPDYVPEA